jgi:hypothetical protein
VTRLLKATEKLLLNEKDIKLFISNRHLENNHNMLEFSKSIIKKW